LFVCKGAENHILRFRADIEHLESNSAGIDPIEIGMLGLFKPTFPENSVTNN